MLRILVLASTYPRWPNDTLPPFVHELARRLADKFEVHVLAPHAPGAKTQEQLDGVEVHRFRYLPERFETLAYGGGMLPGLRRRPWRLLMVPVFLMSELISAARLVRSKRIDVIHAHWILPQGLIGVLTRFIAGRKPALLCTAHGADVFALKGIFPKFIKSFTLRRCDRIAVVSTAMAHALSRQFPAVQPRCAILPMGVDTQSRFVPPSGSRDPCLLLFVGRLAEKKGVAVLLKALALAIRKFPDIHLAIIGDGPQERDLKRQTNELELTKHARFLGALPNHELTGWYQKAMALVFPSVVATNGDQEGLGLVPIEAMACGCPVVASDLPAVRDVITDSETGLLVSPGDAAALAQAIETILADGELRARLAVNARHFVTNRFDWKIIADRYSVILSECAIRQEGQRANGLK